MSLILGTATGLVIGGAYGLLHTPRSGKENRQLLKQYSHDVKESSQDVKVKFDRLDRSINNLNHELEMLQGPVAAEFKRIFHQYQVDIAPRVDRIKDRQNQLTNTVENMDV